MGHLRAATGRYINLFDSRRHIVTPASSDTYEVKSRLGIGRPSKAFRFGSAAANLTLRTDGNLITNGTATTDASVDYGLLDTWTGGAPTGSVEVVTGTGTVVEEAVIVRSGKSAAVDPGAAGTAAFYFDVVVKSGWTYTVEAYARGTTGPPAGVARLEIQNLDTKKYLTSGGAWQAAAVDWTTESNTSYVQKTLPFTVESYAACGWRDTVTLRLRFYNTVASSLAYFDDIAIWPHVDLLTFHGHNFDPSIDAQWSGDEDPAFGSATGIGALSPLTIPAAYIYAGSLQAYRYTNVTFAGTNSVSGAPRIGEAVLTQSTRLTQHYEPPIFWRDDWNQQATSNPSGESSSFRRTLYEQRFPTFLYHWTSQADLDQAISVWRRAEGRTYPAVVVPDTDRPEVIFGHLPRGFSMQRELTAYYTGFELMVDESPFPPNL